MMIYYTLGEGITAFTTDRTIGRDPELIWQSLEHDGAVPQGLPHRYARPHQTHGDRTLLVADDFFALPANIQEMIMEGKDAVMTQIRGLVLGVSTADCIPIILYDPEHRAAAAVHAGWRGTQQRIVRKTIEEMRQTFHTDTAQLRCAIGPGISMDSFEVGDEVYQVFVDVALPMNDSVARRYPAHDGERWHLDLKEINRQQLLADGVPAANIEVSPVDTYTDARFYSARREQLPGDDNKCGRIFTAFLLHQ